MPRDIDLNLLRALDAIMDEQSVTKAALRLGLSQPAMSAALSKLRRHYQDDLMVRVGNTYELTPLARDLMEPAARALREANRVFFPDEQFDPATVERAFSIITSDYGMMVLGPPVSRRLRERAPGARLQFHVIHEDAVVNAADTLRAHDLIIMPHGYLRGLPHKDIYEDDWVCIVSSDNDAVGDALTVETLAAMPWAICFNARQEFNLATQPLRVTGIEPQVEVETESFISLGALVAGTPRVALVQTRIAEMLERAGAVRTLPCPFEPSPIVETMWWHQMFDNDPAHTWLRSLFTEAGIEIQ